jgi:hypothetical protein
MGQHGGGGESERAGGGGFAPTALMQDIATRSHMVSPDLTSDLIKQNPNAKSICHSQSMRLG